MNGYTQANVRAMQAGSKRANEMKEEINWILQWACRQIDKQKFNERFDRKRKTIFLHYSQDLGVINGKQYFLILAETAGPFEFCRVWPSISSKETEVGGNLNVAGLSLNLVLAVYNGLPAMMDDLACRIPGLPEKIQQLIDFAEY